MSRQPPLNMRGVSTNKLRNETGQPAWAPGIAATGSQVVQLCLVLAAVCHTVACVGVVGRTNSTVGNGGSTTAAAEITPTSVDFTNVAVGSSAKQAFSFADIGT